MRATLLALLFALPIAGQEKSSIRFPLIVQSAAPTAASKLSAETIYVIDADIPILVLSSPQGLVSVSMDEGPIKIRGRFADGSGKVETRTYKGKQVYTIEAVTTGTVELLVVPVGTTKESEVLRKTLQVDAQNPQPPPGPKPPDPKPPGPSPIPLPGLRVLIVFEEMEKNKLTAGQKEIISGAPMRDFLDSKCVLGADGKTREYRIWDKDVPLGGAPKHWRDAMSRGQKSIPWIVVSNGTEAFEGPLPATMDETKKLIQQYAD